MSGGSSSFIRVLTKAAPALFLIAFIFISLILVAEYTQAFYLVILLWIVLPFIALRLFRRIRSWLERKDIN